MAITRARKEELLAEYRRQLEESTGFVMVEYTGLSVSEMQTLRRQTREVEGEIFVVKNTLFGLALDAQGIEAPAELLTGPTIVAFSQGEVPTLAKSFRDAQRSFEEDRFLVKGGLLEGRIFGPDEVEAVAALPTRDELLATVLRTINAPATQTAGVIASGVRQVLNVIKAYADKLEEGGGTAAEAAAAA